MRCVGSREGWKGRGKDKLAEELVDSRAQITSRHGTRSEKAAVI